MLDAWVQVKLFLTLVSSSQGVRIMFVDQMRCCLWLYDDTPGTLKALSLIVAQLNIRNSPIYIFIHILQSSFSSAQRKHQDRRQIKGWDWDWPITHLFKVSQCSMKHLMRSVNAMETVETNVSNVPLIIPWSRSNHNLSPRH